MFFVDLLFAVAVALLLTVLFSPRIRESGLDNALAVFFLVLLFTSWAGGVWVAPFGPSLWGGFWMPFALIGIFVALLITVLLPVNLPRASGERRTREQAASVIALDTMFWVFLLGLIATIIARYL